MRISRRVAFTALFPLLIASACNSAGVKPEDAGLDAGSGPEVEMDVAADVGGDMPAAVCGDGVVASSETCDDGNTVGGDGCSADCTTVEPGYACPTAQGVGGACQKINPDHCGDGKKDPGEFCDDGNTDKGDGCSDQCTIEPGYDCPVFGQHCNRVAICGDGKLDVATEQCDDGNTTPGDGCSALCVTETNYVCPVPGMLCISTVKCGDRIVNGDETCDDGNTAPGDGCSELCKTESGWTCVAGVGCRPTLCGDGIKVGAEQCDDGNTINGDGCEATCTLTLPGPTDADGWKCPTVGQLCVRTNCGDGIVEGSEQCDDGNNDSGDGCSPFCRKEPVCPAAGGACATACGDGLLLPVDKAAGQECDDGNTVSGDGCSSTCKIEPGYVCTDAAITQDPLILPLILRDFKAFNSQPATSAHPDFQQFNGAQAGLVASALGANGKPQRVHVTMTKEATMYDGAGNLVGTDWFAMWYKDTPAYNKTVRQTMTLARLPTGEFQFNADDTDNPNDGFFPLDRLGWMDDQQVTTGMAVGTHNFYFTSEVRYWFEYRGNEKLDFTGDDDVWVFINKRLAVDLGGIHSATNGTVTLDATNGTGVVCDLVNVCGATTRNVDFGLTIGSVYEIVVFQAERHTSKSAYRLSLSNFTGTRSTCATVCGDGVVAGREICDLGTAKNTGAYGTCNQDCTLPPRCGDAVVQTPPEQCDDGVNASTYGAAAKVCGPGCLWAPYCGDGKVDATKSEACDQGADNGKGYGFCTAACQLGPRCGDGVVSNGEECDGTANCTSACKKIIIP